MLNKLPIRLTDYNKLLGDDLPSSLGIQNVDRPTLDVVLQTSSEWHIVFYISASIYMFGCVFYAFSASGNRQSWANINKEENDPKTGNSTLTLSTVN